MGGVFSRIKTLASGRTPGGRADKPGVEVEPLQRLPNGVEGRRAGHTSTCAAQSPWVGYLFLAQSLRCKRTLLKRSQKIQKPVRPRPSTTFSLDGRLCSPLRPSGRDPSLPLDAVDETFFISLTALASSPEGTEIQAERLCWAVSVLIWASAHEICAESRGAAARRPPSSAGYVLKRRTPHPDEAPGRALLGLAGDGTARTSWRRGAIERRPIRLHGGWFQQPL